MCRYIEDPPLGINGSQFRDPVSIIILFQESVSSVVIVYCRYCSPLGVPAGNAAAGEKNARVVVGMG